MENMETSKKILDRDFWVGAGLVIIGIILLTQIEVAERIHGIYPGFVFGLITLMGLLLFISSVRKKEFIHIKNSFITLLEAVYFLIILANLFLIDILGFYVSSTIIVIVLFMLSMGKFSLNLLGIAAIYSLSLMVVVYIVFTYMLGLAMPSGILF